MYYKIPRKLHKYLDEFNKNISRVLSGHYVNNFEELSENNFRVQVTKENKSYTEMEKTIIGIKDELVLHFKKYIKNPDLRIIGDYDKVFIDIFDIDALWKNLETDITTSNLFKEKISKNEIFYLGIIVSSEKVVLNIKTW